MLFASKLPMQALLYIHVYAFVIKYTLFPESESTN